MFTKKKRNIIWATAALIAGLSLSNTAFASEEAGSLEENDTKNNNVEIVTYDRTNLDLVTGLIEDKTYTSESTLTPILYKAANELELKEENNSLKEEVKKENVKKEEVHEDVVEIKGTSKYANATEKEPGLVSYRNYKPGILSNFDIRSKNPEHINGDYINKFLAKRTHSTPLKGQGDTIMKYSKKYGINVGIFMGQIAKETTFGMNAAGGRYNFGSVRYVKNGIAGEYGPAYARGAAWINPPTVEAGIEVLFKLLREGYADKGYTSYKQFINRYSPSFENDHRSFEQLAVGTLNALKIPY